MSSSSSILPAGLESLGIDQKQKQKTASKDVGQQQFLELMVAQLKNQDPESPMQSGEFLSQIAQFGTVSGIKDLQTSFGSLASALQSSQALQASTMVGRKVLIESDAVQVKGTEDLGLAVNLTSAATDVRLTIKDESGQTVRQLTFGARDSGLLNLKVDATDAQGNPLANGRYKLTAEALVGGVAQGVTTLVQAPVESVTLPRNGEAAVLNLSGYGAVKIDAVARVL